MVLILADRVKETTTSTGTTAITLAGAATGYQTFSSAVGNANTTYYTIADQTGANWEVGIGTYTTSGNTLSRDTVLASSNAGNLVAFTAGVKDVFISYPAERALYAGGPLGTPSSGTLTNATGYTYANLSGTVPTWNQNTTGTAAGLSATLAIASGGTNSTATATAGGVGYGTGTAYAFTAAGTAGQVLTSNGAAAPTWATASGGATKTISNKTAAYTVVAGDLGTIINCTSGTFTVSLTAAATLGSGFTCTIWNTGTGAITIDPNAAETIDGVATLILRQGEGTDIVCNGTNWETSYKKTMRGYAENYLSTATRPVATTGNNAIAIGNSYASGADSFAAAIANNTSSYGATNTSAIALGALNKATGIGTVAIGNQNTASGNGYGTCLGGYNNTASGERSTTVGGTNNTASGKWSVALGENAKANLQGKLAFSVGIFAAQGDSQYGQMVLRAVTTTTTAVVLTSDAGAASTTNQLILASGQAMAISGTLIAKQTASWNMAGWTITGIVSNNAGTMAVSGLALTAIGTDSIGLGAAPTIAVDNTNKGVTITSGYKAATSIRWVANVQTSEVLYA